MHFEQSAPSQRRGSFEDEGPSSREMFQALIQAEIDKCFTGFISKDRLLGQGQNADVYFGPESSGLGGVCVKFLERRADIYARSLRDEMQLQQTAYRLLDEAARSGRRVARAPNIFFYLQTEEEKEALVMERIYGKTLYREMLERIAQTAPMVLEGMRSKDEIPSLNDRDLETLALERFLKTQGKSPVQIYEILVDCLKKQPFLPKGTIAQLRESLLVLHKQGFYHRDLHWGNVMLSPDLMNAYIIDFGTSSKGEFSPGQNPYEFERMGVPIRYKDDSSIIGTMLKFAK